jgi:transposase
MSTAPDGCPVVIEVLAGNTSVPSTVGNHITKLKERFGLKRLMVGDRGISLRPALKAIASRPGSTGSPR